MTLYNIKLWTCFVLGLLIVISCKEDLSYREPSGNDNSIPGLIQNIEVKNLPGKSKITYRVPLDQNLLYIKAVYTLNSGKTVEVKSSYYSDSIVVEGFADTLEHEIKLYSVNKREVASAPISVTVKPLTAPIWFVRKSLQVNNAFGGYKLTALNPTKSRIAILVMKKNVFNEWEVDNNKSIYTAADSINAKVSGLDTLNYNFAIAVRDRWDNLTDTIYKDVKPIYEVEFPYTKYGRFPLPGDKGQTGADIDKTWDNRIGVGWPVCFTSTATEFLYTPHTVTFDMGVTGKVSKIWIRPFKELSGLYYSFGTMKRFEVWGSTKPNLSGAMDESWIKLGTYLLKKPSGLGSTETPDDQAQAAAGFFFEADLNAPKVKYIRIRNLENFAGQCFLAIDELRVYGDPR